MLSSTHLWLQADDSFLLHFFYPWLYHRVSGSSGIWYVAKISIIQLVLGPLSELQGQWPGYILPFGVFDSRRQKVIEEAK